MARQTLSERMAKVETVMREFKTTMDNHLEHHRMILTRFIFPTLICVIMAVVGIAFVVFQQIILRLLQ